MLDLYQQLLAHQFDASLCTLNACIDRCPDEAWHAPVVNLAYCQAVFHTLFFADLYLDDNPESFRRQPFHLANADFFGDYEELEDRPQVNQYEKTPIRTYLDHCRDKAGRVIAAETVESLLATTGFDWLKFTRCELHVYNIRHIQHHAAQLSLRLRIDTGDGVPGVRSGWREFV